MTNHQRSPRPNGGTNRYTPRYRVICPTGKEFHWTLETDDFEKAAEEMRDQTRNGYNAYIFDTQENKVATVIYEAGQ